MAFVDEYHFRAAAGKGGDGVVRWRREKFIPKGGPSGGDGGRGGDVYLEAVRDIMALGRIAHKDHYQAQAGEPGGASKRTGGNGEDLTIKLPVGAVVTNTTTGSVIELLTDQDRICLLKGGAGGYGNEHFKSSTNQTPQECTSGHRGEEGAFSVELRLVADVGLVGLPNAGKTSLLNALTNAGARVGDYPFTTLDPNLGVYQGYILADMPGLIEGASSGKGLGHKFLRHISRTTIILHCISLERDTVVEDYNVVRAELVSHGLIADKPEYIVLTKSDMMTEQELHSRIQLVLKQTGVAVLAVVSVYDDTSIKELGDQLVKALRGGSSTAVTQLRP
jgi:GTP-binding protein